MFPSTDQASTIPWLMPLPRPNRRLSALAHVVAERARPLIAASGGSSLIGITAEAGEILRITWWNDRMTVYAELSSNPAAYCDAISAEGALQRSGAALLAYLAGRWPSEAVPPALGVVTDGVGVAFSPCHPSPCEAGWLQRHGSGAARPVAILPFAPGGTGALLAADPHDGLTH